MIDKIIKKCKVENKPFTMFDAYSIAKYGSKFDEESLKKTCISGIQDQIKAKSNNGSYYATFELDENLPKLHQYLVDHFTSLGFRCLLLNSEVNPIINVPLLYISWKINSNN